MKTLVAGGTGFVGSTLVRELTARGHDVTVLARHPGDADLPDGVTRVALDLTEASDDALRETLAGHDAVVNLVALSPLFTPSGGNRMHEAVHLDGTRKLVAAAEAAGRTRDGGPPRFVQMSALGADPDGDTHYIRAKGRAETVVRDSDLDWTVVRPSVVFGDGGEFVGFTRLLTTPYVTGLPGGGSTRFQPVWVGDLAPMLADCADAETDERVGRTYELGGPEVLTLADVARRVYAAEGRSLVVLPVPMPLARVGLTLAGMVPGAPMGPDQYRSLRFDNTVGGGDPAANDVTAFGVDPDGLRTLESYLAGDDAGGRRSGEAGKSGGSEDQDAPEVTDGGLDRATDGDGGLDHSDDGDGGTNHPGDCDDRPNRGGDGDGSLLVGRDTLALFAFLAVSWLVPEVAASRFGVDLYATGLIFLYIPSYLVSMVFYDGLFGLEAVTYAVQNAVPGESALAWDAGLLVTYYLFAVAAVAVGRVLRARFGPRATGDRGGRRSG